MSSWNKLNTNEFEEVYSKFYNIQNSNLDTLKFDTKEYLNLYYHPFNPDHKSLKNIFKNLFIAITNEGENMYALDDINHPGYEFNPREKKENKQNDLWKISIYSDGDDHSFMTKDFKNILTGNYRTGIITIIGNLLIKEILKVKEDLKKIGFIMIKI